MDELGDSSVSKAMIGGRKTFSLNTFQSAGALRNRSIIAHKGRRKKRGEKKRITGTNPLKVGAKINLRKKDRERA